MKKLAIVIGIFFSVWLFQSCSSGTVGLGGTSYYGYSSPYYRNPNPNFGYYGYGRPYIYQAPFYTPGRLDNHYSRGFEPRGLERNDYQRNNFGSMGPHRRF